MLAEKDVAAVDLAVNSHGIDGTDPAFAAAAVAARVPQVILLRRSEPVSVIYSTPGRQKTVINANVRG